MFTGDPILTVHPECLWGIKKHIKQSNIQRQRFTDT